MNSRTQEDVTRRLRYLLLTALAAFVSYVAAACSWDPTGYGPDEDEVPCTVDDHCPGEGKIKDPCVKYFCDSSGLCAEKDMSELWCKPDLACPEGMSRGTCMGTQPTADSLCKYYSCTGTGVESAETGESIVCWDWVEYDLPDGTAVGLQTEGDCKVASCVGGKLYTGSNGLDDPTDIPDDNNDCTADSCGEEGFKPTHDFVDAGKACTSNGGNVCDGIGNCVQCLQNDDCAPNFICQNQVCLPGTCGDGTVNGDEECDENNTVNGDGCDVNCTFSVCGNGIKAGAEQCDDGNLIATDACTDMCVPAQCGDNIAWAGVEECDDGDNVSNDECDPNCKFPGCGNGFKAGLESCDDGNTVNGDGCDVNCTPTACGNGIKTGMEACDDGNQDDDDSCLHSCVAAKCGDTFVWSPAKGGTEQCDDGNMMAGDGCEPDCTLTP